MPRVISIAETRYEIGAHGPLSVDQISNANTEALEWTMTVGPDWPADRTQKVVAVTLAWDTGGGATWVFNGGLRKQDGTPLTQIRERVLVSTENDGSGGVRKRAVSGGTMSMQVFTPITTAITVAGV